MEAHTAMEIERLAQVSENTFFGALEFFLRSSLNRKTLGSWASRPVCYASPEGFRLKLKKIEEAAA